MPESWRDENASLASFLLPDGYRRPRLRSLLDESRVVVDAARMLGPAADRATDQSAGRATPGRNDPVLLVPGFLAGDVSLRWLSRGLRDRGFRTYRSHIRANIGCTQAAVTSLEARVESIAIRRNDRVSIVGHSLGGLLARGLAVRRPDLIAGIVTLGSPMLAPGAHHPLLTASLDALVRLSRAGVPGVMSEDCIAGRCARESFEQSRLPVPADVAFTAVYSRRDGIVDWRACIDSDAAAVEVSCSHLGMAVDPHVLAVVAAALSEPDAGSVLEVDRGESA